MHSKIKKTLIGIALFILIVFLLIYKDLKNNKDERKKNSKLFLTECLTNLYPDDIKEEIQLANIKKYIEVKKNFDDNAVLFLTHGTATRSTPENYYFSKEGVRDNKSFMKTLCSFTNSSDSYYLRWSGILTHEERIKTSLVFKKRIEDKIEEIALAKKGDAKKIPINLAAHSFGVSVMMLTANKLIKEGYNVQMLISFNVPVNTYKIENKKIIHINFYSSKDWSIQTFGAFYFFNNFTKISYFGPARVIYPEAININIDKILDRDKILFYKNGEPEKRLLKSLNHNAARNESVLLGVQKIISGLVENEKKEESIPEVIKKWEGIYRLKNKYKDIQKIEISYENKFILISDYDSKKIIYKIPSGGNTFFENHYKIDFFPFVSLGSFRNRFYMDEKEISYSENGFFLFFNTGTKTKTKVSIIKEDKGTVSIK